VQAGREVFLDGKPALSRNLDGNHHVMLSRLYRTLTVSIQLILDESGLSVNTGTCFFINLYFFFASAEKIGSPDEKRKNQQYGKG